jgi:hypothetical protein
MVPIKKSWFESYGLVTSKYYLRSLYAKSYLVLGITIRVFGVGDFYSGKALCR